MKMKTPEGLAPGSIIASQWRLNSIIRTARSLRVSSLLPTGGQARPRSNGPILGDRCSSGPRNDFDVITDDLTPDKITRDRLGRERVFLRDRVLELQCLEGRLHVARKEKRPDE